MNTILVTGGAGFIGSHLVRKLLKDGQRVLLLDNFNPFYDPALKRKNLRELQSGENGQYLTALETDIRNVKLEEILNAAQGQPIHAIVHLAAMAGVRPSLEDPMLYQDVNVLGTQNMLELAHQLGVGRFVLASSSSVYGVNPTIPWSEYDALKPISPYAASKISAEALCGVYTRLYGMDCIALRLFTVYGPGQRPDLAISKFIKSAIAGKPITLYGKGDSRRDYTFVSDIVDAFCKALNVGCKGFNVVNIGCGSPVSLLDLVRTIEEVLGHDIEVHHVEAQPGDVPVTYANVQKARYVLGYVSQVGLRDGIMQQVEAMISAG